jgi:hypothetical protein
MSPDFLALGLIDKNAMMKQKTKAINMLNNMSYIGSTSLSPERLRFLITLARP